MRQFHKILLGVFSTGILIGGIGAGIAFTEFSSLTYEGEVMIGKNKPATEEIDVEFEPGEEKYQIHGYRGRSGMVEVMADESVPENTVRFRIAYNEAKVKPYVEVQPEEQIIYLYCQWQSQDEVALFMEAKDRILGDLKEGKVSSYREPDLDEVTILVNPANEDDIERYF